MTPIRKGTAERLGLRKPLAAYKRRWMMGVSMAECEEALRDNPNLNALREASKVNWLEEWRFTEVLEIAPFRP